ncbi:MAG: adenine phosphoribosyltransferase [Deltaproteobacteria bacterium]|nr:adenine phosphoribosyltransferase [Deltaproteobacteria bacterium]
MDLSKTIRDVPDFPKKGILFKDITTLLKDPSALRECVQQLTQPFINKGIKKVCGIESRGFIFGTALALELGAGFVPVRKAGKLPYKTVSQEYALEYGTDKIEIHVDAIEKGERVLIVDDLLATGGTAAACMGLLKKIDAQIYGFAFLVELAFLNGRQKLTEGQVVSLVVY